MVLSLARSYVEMIDAIVDVAGGDGMNCAFYSTYTNHASFHADLFSNGGGGRLEASPDPELAFHSVGSGK
jgi:hypothetical protein